MKNFLILFILSFCIQIIGYSQQKVILNPDIKLTHKINTTVKINQKKYDEPNFTGRKIDKDIKVNNKGIKSIVDTLTYNDGTFNSSIVINGQEWLMQWYKAPADLTIKKVGFYCTSNQRNDAAQFKIVKVEWTEDSLFAILDNIGYYPALGNGCYDVTALGYDATGQWTSSNGYSEPFSYDIWSDGGYPVPFTPTPNIGYQWINMDILFEPQIYAGEIFGVAVKNSAICDSGQIGFLAGEIGPPSWKFYPNGPINPGVDIGWWTNQNTLDFPVVVDITGDTPPDFNSFTTLPSGVDYGPYTVDANITDENPGNPPNSGVATAKLIWSGNGGATWNEVTMSGSEPNFSAVIPAQAPGSTVIYFLEATDVANQTSVSVSKSFYLFQPSGANTLVVLNGYNQTEGYPQDYFFGPDIQSGTASFDHDIWAYGQPPSDLFNNYTNIIEICNGVPEYYLDSLIRPWLTGGSNRNYYLEGQEWLGARYSYVDKNFAAGDFEFDVLGINASFNDVSYANSTGQLLPSKLTPQAGTLFGQPLLDKFATYSPAPDSIQYNPTYLGQSGDLNWIDGFNVESDVVVDVLTESRGIAGVPNVQNLPCVVHRTLPNGNKIFFAGYWTYAVNTATDILMPTYHWLGNTNESCGFQALVWFGITISDVKQVGSGVPEVYSLSQNYPNPFNPSTSIQYAISSRQLVQLKVYDILGSEVATLVNEEQSAGNYKVDFNASHLSSGVYFYQIKAGEFISTKKIILIK